MVSPLPVMEGEGAPNQRDLLNIVRGKITMKSLLHVVQLIAVIALIAKAQNNQWSNINADFQYTEGVPIGVGMEANVNISANETTNQIDIKGLFNLSKWNNMRNDSVTIESEEEDSSQEDYGFENISTLEEVREEIAVMNKIAISLVCILLILNFWDVKYRSFLGLIITGLIFWIFISLAFRAPLGYIASANFGDSVPGVDESDDGESSVHPISVVEYSWNDTSATIFINYSSYDLGLVNASNLSEVIENPPGEDHPSFMKMEGKISLTIAKFISDLFYIWLGIFVLIPAIMTIGKRVSIDNIERVT
tara:strand:+ start:1253 stop:2173 length:921 start_codon:yes stop_codon:yes gene_type:complete